ncbi:Zinc finger MYM-type protein 6 [Araneus ventricosus]|uniref:Zinc finger MYM-type protein 6 n=1 Tax=Araneus ventricosus TaxID=182803 RepID=A0A4Y1ZZH5_ARAVE|nr:Zinc finger MYM-type protein 6 [Araneus ventricosus]
MPLYCFMSYVHHIGYSRDHDANVYKCCSSFNYSQSQSCRSFYLYRIYRECVPLSNDTVARRIGDIIEDVQHQLFEKLRDKFLSIQLDEAMHSNKDAHLIAYVRFCDGMSAVEEQLFCKPIELKATTLALFTILNDFINKEKIEWKNCVGMGTDGVSSMSGRFQSIRALVKQKSSQCV